MMGVISTEQCKQFICQQKRMGTRLVIHLWKQSIKSLSQWRQPLVGYLCAIPIVLVSLFVAVFLQQLLHRFLFPASFLLLSLLLFALVWGVGPALLVLVTGMIAMVYYFIPLVSQFTLISGGDIVQVLPVFVIGLVMLLVIGQRERAYIKIQKIDQELQRYASDLEAINSRLDDENREKDRVLSIASHELKTPVTTIRGHSQLLLHRLAKRSTSVDMRNVESAFKSINDQTTRLAILIDKLLDVNNLDSDRTVLSKIRYDLNQLCHRVVEDQRLLTSRDVIFSPSSEPLELQMDVDCMTQVVINLVSNALKYSSEEKPVEVRVSRNEQKALLQVQDYGCGIAHDDIAHIFEMFYRAPQARSSTTHGLGLGLAISKELVDQHEGRIWCESELGVGTTFFVELPLFVEG